jgi:hypothetical protein
MGCVARLSQGGLRTRALTPQEMELYRTWTGRDEPPRPGEQVRQGVTAHRLRATIATAVAESLVAGHDRDRTCDPCHINALLS